MSEEINEEQPEAVEEKSLEDEIAALEEVASTLGAVSYTHLRAHET